MITHHISFNLLVDNQFQLQKHIFNIGKNDGTFIGQNNSLEAYNLDHICPSTLCKSSRSTIFRTGHCRYNPLKFTKMTIVLPTNINNCVMYRELFSFPKLNLGTAPNVAHRRPMIQKRTQCGPPLFKDLLVMSRISLSVEQ